MDMFLESNVLKMSRNLVMPVLEFYGKNAKSNVDISLDTKGIGLALVLFL